jgi:hypothetical protein
MKAKKSKGKPGAKRAAKDLAPRKSQDVKGGSFFDFGGIIKSVVQTTLPIAIDTPPASPAQPIKPAR